MKISKIGWVGKTTKYWMHVNECYNFIEIHGISLAKGIKDNWPYKDWPPRKVRITVEDCKEDYEPNR